jgi:hypothetical protein
MGVWNTLKTSYQSQGVFNHDMNYHPSGFSNAFALANPGARRPVEGFLHSIKRGIADNIIESGYSGTGVLPLGLVGGPVKYGGSIFTAGGIREIKHELQAVGTGRFMIGAERNLTGKLKTGIFKSVTPAFFLYDAYKHGIGQASKDAIINGAIWGGGKWALGRAWAGLSNPALLATTALVGAGIAAQKALVMGKKYNASVRAVSFGNAFNDVYGNAATMRQASLMAVQSSKINGRNILGQEANLFHA